MLKRLIAFFLLCFLSFNIQTYAATGDVFGLGPRSQGLARATDATDPQVHAASANPAGATRVGKIGAFALVDHNLELTGVSSNAQGGTTSGIPEDPYRHEKAASLRKVVFGLNLPLSERLTFNASGQMPLDHFARVHIFTGNEVNYLHLDDRQSRPEIYTSFAAKLTDHLALGAGLMYSAKAEGVMQLAISDTDAESRMVMELKPVFVPFLGGLWNFEAGRKIEMGFGGYYRFPHQPRSDVTIDTRFDVNGPTLPFQAVSKVVAFYDPPMASGGVHFKYLKKYSFFLGLEWAGWSHYQAPVFNLSGQYLDDLNGGAIVRDPIELKNTWSYRFAFEWLDLLANESRKLDLGLGLAMTESAMPKVPKTLAVVDAKRTSVGTYGSFKLMRPIIIEMPLSIIWSLRWDHLKREKYLVSSSFGRTISAQVGGDVYSVMGGVALDF